jgi:hypothetical protein
MSETNFAQKDDKFRSNEIGTQFVIPKYQLVEFVRKLHKDTARIVNKLDDIPGRKI